MPTPDTDDPSCTVAAVELEKPREAAQPALVLEAVRTTAAAASFHQVSIQPQWTISNAGGRSLPPRLVELLQVVQQQGSLLAACRSTLTSYRHAWQLIREGEAVLGAALMTRTRYQGSRLTPLALKLLWAETRVQTRLSAMLRDLEAELETDIAKAPLPQAAGVRMHASSGPAVAALREALASAGVDLWYRDSPPLEAIALLEAGRCDVASLFVPSLEVDGGSAAAPEPKRKRGREKFEFVPVAARVQGLLVARGNPRRISGLGDLRRAGVRFANREAGCEARLLTDWLFERAGIDPMQVSGYEQHEPTQSAVAAAIASGRADAGIGVESLARQFGLDFIPLHAEHCVLLYPIAALKRPAMRELLSTLQGTSFRASIDRVEDHHAAGTAEPVRLRHIPFSWGLGTAERLADGAASAKPRADAARQPEAAVADLLSRRSISPKRLQHSAPSPEAIDLMLQAALRGPDHGGLCPWRVIEIREAQRAALADCFEQEKLRRDPLSSAADLRRAREHAIRPPALLAFVVATRLRSKVPVREQSLAAGAALGNLLNAAHHLGFGAIVLSGERCFDEALQRRLGIAGNEFLAGFVSLGSIADSAPPARHVLATRVRSCWMPEG